MTKRRMIRLAVYAFVLMSLPVLLGGCVLEYSGQLFTSSRSPQLCATAFDSDGSRASGVIVSFDLTTLWGRTIETGDVTTNAFGVACLRTTLPSDVYRVYPVAKTDFESIPSVLTIYSPRWTGVFAGGRVEIPECDPCPNACVTPTRDATFGVIYRTDQAACRTARLLFIDPFSPIGPVEIRAQDFTVETNGEIRLSGPATFINNGNLPFSIRFEAVLTDADSPTFAIQVFQYPSTVLYEASGQVFEGGVVIQ